MFPWAALHDKWMRRHASYEKRQIDMRLRPTRMSSFSFSSYSFMRNPETCNIASHATVTPNWQLSISRDWRVRWEDELHGRLIVATMTTELIRASTCITSLSCLPCRSTYLTTIRTSLSLNTTRRWQIWKPAKAPKLLAPSVSSAVPWFSYLREIRGPSLDEFSSAFLVISILSNTTRNSAVAGRPCDAKACQG